MGDVQELTTNGLDDSDAVALLHLQSVVADLLRKGRPDQAVGELISYTLSNQALIEKGKKTKTYRPLMSFVIAGLKEVAKFLGIKGSFNPGDTLFSNIRFNARLLATPAPEAEAATVAAEVESVMGQTYPKDDARLSALEQTYFRQLKSVLGRHQRGTAESIEERNRVAKAIRTARAAAEQAVANGFELNPRQAHAFAAIHATISTGLKADQPVQRHLYEAFGHVLKTLTPEQLVAAGVADATRAADMHAFLTGAKGLRKTADDRTDLLASFMALSQVDTDLRETLGKMKPPKVAELQWGSVDDWVRSIMAMATNLITRLSLKPRLPAGNLRRELDLLGATLTEIEGERRVLSAFLQINEKVDQANAFLSRHLARVSETATTALSKKADGVKFKPVRGALFVTTYLTALGSETASAAAGDTLTKMLNNTEGFGMLRSLLSDMRGMTDSNAPLMRLINPAKAQIDQLRQDFREGVPAELTRAFTRKLKREEWSRLHKGIARADLLALGLKDARELIADPTQLRRMTDEALEAMEKLSRPLGKTLAKRYQAKAQALATHMVLGSVTSEHLLPNAFAIAHLVGEDGGPLPSQVTPELVDAIDRLTSLYAYQKLDSDTRATLTELMADETKGMETVTGFLNVVRQMEIDRRDRHGSTNIVAQMNGLKGYVPALPREGASLIVGDAATEHDKLVRRGYVKVGNNYAGDPRAGRGAPRSYYQSSVGGKAQFRQGVAQTVHETWQGVDARTGAPVGHHAGLLLGKRAQKVAQLARASSGRNDGVPAGEYLRPIFDEKGAVSGYVRSMDPAMLERLPKDEHLGRMLGVWAGRILEETVADEANQTLVKTTKQIWDEAVKNGETDQFVNVADKNQKDPIIRDAWDTFGWRLKQEAEAQFGEPDLLFSIR